MKTLKRPDKRQEKDSQVKTALPSLHAREPGKAALLSLMPGLGQIYNGETGKGLLFIAVSLANLLLLCLLFFTGPLLRSLIDLAFALNADPKINIGQAMEIVQSGRAVTLVYLGLILSFMLYAARDAYDGALEKRRGKPLPRFKLSMPEATSGSYLVHFSLITALLMAVIFFALPPKPQIQQTDIELLSPVEPPPKKEPEAPKPKPEPPKEVKKSEPPKKVQAAPPTPPKPTPVAVAVPTKDPVPDPVVQSDEAVPDPGPVSETGGSPNGTPGGSGSPGGGGDGEDVDFGSYLSEVQKRIKRNWFPPRGAESLSITLKFKVAKDGKLHGNIKLVKSSGIAAADDAARTAIVNASPFPPLPKGAGDDVDIKFTFDYNVFNGKLSQ